MKGVFIMSRKRKYSDELKLKIVKEYFEGKSGGYKSIANKYGVPCSPLRRWINLYQYGGAEALVSALHTYSGEFKINVVEYMHQHSLSIHKAAAYFHIPSPTTLSKWERIYYEEGKEALLEERRGRSKMASDARKGRPPKKDVNKNEDLLTEVQYLRMENEYLKKLIALTQEREKQEKKTK